MKFIKPSFKIISEKNQLKNVEYFGRICYRSEDKITPDSYKTFVKGLIKRGHLAVTEHANYTFKVDKEWFEGANYLWAYLINTPAVKMFDDPENFYIVLNLRHIIESRENGIYDFCTALDSNTKNIISEPQVTHEYNSHIKLDMNNKNNLNTFISVEFNIARGIWDELARHRIGGMNAESSRYCMYADDKFGNELKVAIPYWFDKAGVFKKAFWKLNWKIKEWSYKICTKVFKMQAQEARGILGLDYLIKCGYTASIDQWKKIMKLRLHTSAHPDIREIMGQLADELEKQGIKVRGEK